MYRTAFWTLWEKARVGCFKRTASKHVYYLWWNRSPAQVGCMRQVLGPGTLGRPRGIGWRERGEGGSGWGIHVYPWLIHVNVWQKPLHYCRVISLQLIKKKKKIFKKYLKKPRCHLWLLYFPSSLQRVICKTCCIHMLLLSHDYPFLSKLSVWVQVLIIGSLITASEAFLVFPWLLSSRSRV